MVESIVPESWKAAKVITLKNETGTDVWVLSLLLEKSSSIMSTNNFLSNTTLN